jgi:hypothetical protein
MPLRCLLVDDNDAFDHAREDGAQVTAIVGELVHAASELLDGAIERARHDAELIVAVAEGRTGEVARRVPARDAGDRRHAPRHRRGERPGEQARDWQ